MFDFQELSVYQKAKGIVHRIDDLIEQIRVDRYSKDQLKRAAFSIPLNIAESTSRFSRRDRKNFLTIARGSAFEGAAILEILKEKGIITVNTYRGLSDQLEEISKMLFGMIRRLEN